MINPQNDSVIIGGNEFNNNGTTQHQAQPNDYNVYGWAS